MHKELTASHRIQVKSVAVLVRAYMNSDEEDLTVFYLAVRILEVHLTCPETLNFSAGKGHAAFKPFVDEIIVKGLSVLGYYLDSLLYCHMSSLFKASKTGLR